MSATRPAHSTLPMRCGREPQPRPALECGNATFGYEVWGSAPSERRPVKPPTNRSITDSTRYRCGALRCLPSLFPSTLRARHGGRLQLARFGQMLTQMTRRRVIPVARVPSGVPVRRRTRPIESVVFVTSLTLLKSVLGWPHRTSSG